MQDALHPQPLPKAPQARSHKGTGGAKAKPRPMRCGECHSCRNPRLKKGCLRNQALRSRGIDPASIGALEAQGGTDGANSSPRWVVEALGGAMGVHA